MLVAHLNRRYMQRRFINTKIQYNIIIHTCKYAVTYMLALTGLIDALSRFTPLDVSSNGLSLNSNNTQFISFDTP